MARAKCKECGYERDFDHETYVSWCCDCGQINGKSTVIVEKRGFLEGMCGAREHNERLAGQAPVVSEEFSIDGGNTLSTTQVLIIEGGYEPLADVLKAALDQAQSGKGKERHATGKPFLQQPIMQLRRMVGSGYTLGQAMKKAQEAQRLPAEQAEIDLLGAINYLAAEVLARREECQK